MADRHRTDGVDVELPQDVIDRIEARLPQTGYDSVEAYAASALDLLLRDVATADQDGAAGPTTAAAGECTASEERGTADPGTNTADTGTADTGTADPATAEDGPGGQSSDPRRADHVTDAPDRDAVKDQLESLGYL